MSERSGKAVRRSFRFSSRRRLPQKRILALQMVPKRTAAPEAAQFTAPKFSVY
jgi:hypothetical protein